MENIKETMKKEEKKLKQNESTKMKLME